MSNAAGICNIAVAILLARHQGTLYAEIDELTDMLASEVDQDTVSRDQLALMIAESGRTGIELVNETSFRLDGELVDLNVWRQWADNGGANIHRWRGLYARLNNRHFLIRRDGVRDGDVEALRKTLALVKSLRDKTP